jgi:hypothetical protein
MEALASINDRLGALCRCGGLEAGQDLEPPRHWVQDALDMLPEPDAS